MSGVAAKVGGQRAQPDEGFAFNPGKAELNESLRGFSLDAKKAAT